jgi:hypothetical protein
MQIPRFLPRVFDRQNGATNMVKYSSNSTLRMAPYLEPVNGFQIVTEFEHIVVRAFMICLKTLRGRKREREKKTLKLGSTT